MDEPGRHPAPQLRDLLARQALAIERCRGVVARQLGLSDSEMAALDHLGQQRELTPGELRERLALSSGGTTALIQRLVRAGHVERRPHQHDRRSAVITVTDATRELLAARSAPLVEAIDGAAAALSPADRATIVAWLDRIVDVTEAEAAEDIDGEDRPQAGLTVPNAWF